MNFDQLVDRLTAQFDATRATIELIVNERQRDMVIRARWLKAKRVLATTTSGTNTYVLPADVSSVEDVQVGSSFYDPSGLNDIERRTSGFWFAQTGDTNGVARVQLYPVPDATGTAITATAILSPSTIAYGSSAALTVPQEVHRHLHAGCRAELYVELEDREDLAASQEQVFEVGVVKLRSLSKRVRPGVSRVAVHGYDFTF